MLKKHQKFLDLENNDKLTKIMNEMNNKLYRMYVMEILYYG